MHTKKLVCTLVYVLFIALTLFMVGNIGQYVDGPSLAVVLVLAALFATAVESDERFLKKFGDGAVRAGWLGSIIGVIAIFGTEGFAQGDLSMIGPALAVCSLTIFYGYLVKFGSLLLD